jgi:hypothetical protein
MRYKKKFLKVISKKPKASVCHIHSITLSWQILPASLLRWTFSSNCFIKGRCMLVPRLFLQIPFFSNTIFQALTWICVCQHRGALPWSLGSQDAAQLGERSQQSLAVGAVRICLSPAEPLHLSCAHWTKLLTTAQNDAKKQHFPRAEPLPFIHRCKSPFNTSDAIL